MLGCKVHSPCAGFVVQYSADDRAITIHVTAKHSEPIEFETVLDHRAVEQITADAGVAKEFNVFAKMIHSALVGTSDALSFSVCNVAEATRRLQEEGRMSDVPAAGPEMQHQYIFLVEYCVTFTRAWFTIPLSKVAGGHSTAKPQQARAPSPRTPASSRGELIHDPSPATLPRVVFHDDPSPSSIAGKELKGVASAQAAADADLIDEVKRLKRENAALKAAGERSLKEMQRDCERLKKEFAEVRKLKEQVAHYRDEATSWRTRYYDLERSMKRSGPGATRATPPRGRFDTPPGDRRRTPTPLRSRNSSVERLYQGRSRSPYRRSDSDSERSGGGYSSDRSRRSGRTSPSTRPLPRSPSRLPRYDPTEYVRSRTPPRQAPRAIWR